MIEYESEENRYSTCGAHASSAKFCHSWGEPAPHRQRLSVEGTPNLRSALTWTLASVTQTGKLKIVPPSPPVEILYGLYLELGREITVLLATPTRSGASAMFSWG